VRAFVSTIDIRPQSPIVEIPKVLFVHELTSYFRFLTKPARYPYRRYQNSLLSFATASDLEQSLEIPGCISNSKEMTFEQFIQGKNPLNISDVNAKNFVMDLLRQAWEKSIDDTGMLKYHMGRRTATAYFKNDFIPGNKVKISGLSDRNTSRNLVGYDTRKDREGNVIGKRYWHYSIQFKSTFNPVFAYTAISHVLFSYDGENILGSKKLLHGLRRSKCRDWWNSEWRDRLMGVVQWLASGQDNIQFKLGSESNVIVDAKPLSFNSDVSYVEPKSKIVVLDDEEEESITEEEPE